MTAANTYSEAFSDSGLNPDYQRRDKLLGLEVIWNDDNADDALSVEFIPLLVLEKLFEERFIDPADRQNASPTARQFLEFMRKYPVTVAHGYVIGPDRPDARITIEGLHVHANDVTPDLEHAFNDLCHTADELMMDGDLYSWWD